MESMTLLEGGRNFFSGTYSNDEADFMSQLLGNFSTKLPNISPFENSSTFWPHDEQVDEASIYISDNTNTNMYHLLQENICSDGSNILFPTSSGESYPPIASLRGSKKTVLAIHNNFSPSSRKRSCSLADVQESRKNTKFSTSPKVDHDATCRQITNIYVSDDDSNGPLDPSPRPKGVAVLNSNGKKRASAGSATDSQSIYAKKRRERINERLRVLQNLVPNGTKVDISTMLEEAVEYVKFLQLQIKLLSSDDLWMYAPIAYNGMDIGLDIKLPSPR